MRVFYIFNIREEFKYLYQDSPSMLYNILKQIYYLGHDDILYGQNLFRQLTKSLPKEQIDRALFIKLHQEFPYSKRGDNHIINNLYTNEISKLVVKNAYMKIKTEKNTSSFFPYLSEFSDSLFVCDFEYSDFFFLEKTKTLV
jgi:hypothetical protein